MGQRNHGQSLDVIGDDVIATQDGGAGLPRFAVCLPGHTIICASPSKRWVTRPKPSAILLPRSLRPVSSRRSADMAKTRLKIDGETTADGAQVAERYRAL